MSRAAAVFVASTALKLLLFPAYHSTDFDVHRNWLAITRSLPLKDWYYEATSQWTLDYPPFFAYFEWALAQLVPAAVAADGALDIVPEGRYGWATVAFQRGTVVASELVLAASLAAVARTRARMGLTAAQARAVVALLWLSPAWLLLDHVHFQYNGMLFGLFIFSLVAAAAERFLLCAALFSTLLCFKHIFLYLAPAYFAFLLRAYLLPDGAPWRSAAQLRRTVLRAAQLGLATLAPFVVAFAPFRSDLPQVLARLFPFSRGLTHAYWAPNFWALYSFVDRVLGLVRRNATVAGTRGLVGQVEFSNLPAITPRTTFLLTLFYQALGVVPVLVRPTFPRFAGCLTVAGFASFLFGWHVHEKAIVLVLVPFTFIALSSRRLLASYQTLAVAGHVSLLPLIFTPAETVIKLVYTGAYLVAALATLPELAAAPSSRPRAFLLERPAMLYNLGMLAVLPATAALGVALPRYEFAQLMLLSVYCALGVLFSWVALSVDYFSVDLTGDE